MDLEEIRERLIKAQKNRDALEQQYKHTLNEVERLNTLRIKWAGICDYFQSLLPESEQPKPEQATAVVQVVGLVSGIQN